MSIYYKVRHETQYAYNERVPMSYNQAHILPRDFPWQEVRQSRITIEPEPDEINERVDAYGNRVTYYSIQHSHDTSRTLVEFEVSIDAAQRPDRSRSTTLWHTLAADLEPDLPGPLQSLRPWKYDSPLVGTLSEITKYAEEVFDQHATLLDACGGLMQRIYEDFTFDPDSTDVDTPVLDAFKARRGVCQDFSHIMLAGLRGMGLPARYMSGYLETLPPPGQAKLEGADASHAWVAVYDPQLGWIDLDPTNNLWPTDQHITLGWGRDFSDVIPIRGVVIGGEEQELDVKVDVLRLR
jgi:transglutaminase-like putative cysteine protease